MAAGSSLYSAQLAAQLGLPFAFASHFAPDMLFQAPASVSQQFQTFGAAGKPYAMVCINIIAADSNRDAEFLFTSMQQAFVKLRRGDRSVAAAGGKYASAVVSIRAVWCAAGTSMSLVGDKTKVRHGLESILRETEADEIMVNGGSSTTVRVCILSI